MSSKEFVKLMLEKSKERWDSNYTFFVGDLTEEEQKYRDYYENSKPAIPFIILKTL